MIEKLFQSKRVFESKKMVDDVFFWHTGTHIKMMSRKRDVCIERNVQGGCSVFRGLFVVWCIPSESEGFWGLKRQREEKRREERRGEERRGEERRGEER